MLAYVYLFEYCYKNTRVKLFLSALVERPELDYCDVNLSRFLKADVFMK